MAKRSLLLYTPVTTDSYMIADLSDSADWRRSIRANGGFWQGSLTVTGPVAELITAFYQWPGYHLVERSGGVTTWEGLIYELDLNLGDSTRRRSLNTLYNAVTCTYQMDGIAATLAYATQNRSIARYGRREENLLADNYPVGLATAYRDRYLAENAWPWSRPVTLGAGGAASLAVRVCGYVFTSNWMFVREGDGTDDDIDDWMAQIVGANFGLSANHGGSVSGAGDCEYLKVGQMVANTLQVPKNTETPIRAWDLLAELAGMGDVSGDPWQVWVDLNRKVYYQEIDTTPKYYLRGGQLYDSLAARVAVNPYVVRPAVIRDMDYPVAGAEEGSWLDDRRDAFVEEVEVDPDGRLILKTADILEAEAMAAQYGRYERPEALPWREIGAPEEKPEEPAPYQTW